MRTIVLVIFFLVVGSFAKAQTPVTTGNEFPTLQPGKLSPGLTNMCVDAADGFSKPCGTSSNPIVTTSGSTPSTSAGIAPNASPAATGSIVLKASAGNLYGVQLTSGASAGYLMIFNATSAPADGTVSPAYCKAVAASSSVELAWPSIPAAFTTGITAVFSTTGCFTKTVSATAFISGMAK